MRLIDPQRLSEQAVQHVQEAAKDRAAAIDVILRRAEHLPEPDQLLLELSLRMGYTQRRIARQLGKPAGTISRRLKALGKLLHDPMIIRLLDGPCPLDPNDRQIAVECLLCKHPLREVAQLHQISLAQVHRRLAFVKGWFRGAGGKFRTMNDER